MSTGWRANRPMAAALCVLWLAACASRQPQSVEETPTVARPQIKVGDRWTYQRLDHAANRITSIYSLRVTFASEKSVLGVATESDGRENDVSFTPDWNAIVSAFDQAIASPDTGLLRFPLRAGATYRAGFRIDSTRRTGERSAMTLEGVTSSMINYKVQAVRWEDVEVPAGRFRALRIEADGHMFRLNSIIGAGSGSRVRGIARTVIWYAPEARRWVKYSYEDYINGEPGGMLMANDHVGEELVELRLQ